LLERFYNARMVWIEMEYPVLGPGRVADIDAGDSTGNCIWS